MSISTEIFVPAKLSKAAKRFKLTRRQLQCFVLACNGHTYKSGAGELGISERTFKIHMEDCRKKMKCHSSLHSLAVMLLWK